MTKNIYTLMTRRKISWLSLLAAAVVVTFFIDLCTGPSDLSITDVFSFFFQKKAIPLTGL